MLKLRTTNKIILEALKEFADIKQHTTYFPRIENPLRKRNPIWTSFASISSLPGKKINFLYLSKERVY